MTRHDIPPTNKTIVIERAGYDGQPGQMGLIEEQMPPVGPGQMYLRTKFSGVSAGTAMIVFRGGSPKCAKGIDPETLLFRSDLPPAAADTFPKTEGYEEEAVVTASRNPRFPEGTRVAGQYGPRSDYVAGKNDFLVQIPDTVPKQAGIWIAKLGPIGLTGALNAIDELCRRRPIGELAGSLNGERVAVIGAGMVGLFAAKGMQRAGAELVVVERMPKRIETIGKLGMTALDPEGDIAEALKGYWRRGPDAVIQCTDSNYVLARAIASVRKQGTVIDLGFHDQPATELLLGEEFHHNQVRLVSSQIGGIPESQAALWNRQRLSNETITILEDEGKDFIAHTITDVVPVRGQEDVPAIQAIMERLAARDPEVLQVVLQMNPS